MGYDYITPLLNISILFVEKPGKTNDWHESHTNIIILSFIEYTLPQAWIEPTNSVVLG
jgi:hypothetical protein